jgi:hypothetical protein
MRLIPNFTRRNSHDFRQIVDPLLAQPGLPFADILSAERISQVFRRHGNLFGGVYTTSTVLWAFLGQVLRDGKETACQAAVACVIAYCELRDLAAPTSDTGDYCKARAKLSEAALRDLTREIAAEAEARAEIPWLWKGRHAKLVDGFTMTMADTEANQGEYPQQRGQKAGVGLPIARVGVVLSLATAGLLDAAIGPYAGKQTSEVALLRSMLGSFSAGDIVVADRFYCSFMLIALLLSRNVQVCARLHQSRHTDFRRGRRLGREDHVVVWKRPPRPEWMDEATYDAIPQTLELREIRYRIIEKGSRTQVFTVVTTLTDEAEFSKEEIAELYGHRWNAELDIRSIKQSLNLAHSRCQSPAMVRRELWTTLLAYNLIRTTIAAAACLHDRLPRQISFTAACQFVLPAWLTLACEFISPDRLLAYSRTMLAQIASCEVANRPGRIEPRVIKRRRHRYKLMQEPRAVLKAKLDKEYNTKG